MSDDLLLIREGKGTAKAHRVMTTPQFVQAGRRSDTWYTGSINVDIGTDEPEREVIWVVSTAGSYAYHQDTNANIVGVDYSSGWKRNYYLGVLSTSTDPSLQPLTIMRFGQRISVFKLYRNFVRMFSVRKECDEIFADPIRYLIVVDKLVLQLTTDLAQTDWGVPKVWMGYWGETLADLFVVTLASSALGTSSFNLEVRASSSGQIKDTVALRIYDLKSKEWIVKTILTCNPNQVTIQIVNGLIPAIDFDFTKYKGRRVQALDAGEFKALRVGEKYFDIYIKALL